MITLKKVEINKYKCFESPQAFDVDDDITVLVGKNESGKTAILEAIAKTNYFNNDQAFVFDATLDYPRKDKKQYDKSGQVATVVTATYNLSKDFLETIAADIGNGVFVETEFVQATNYKNVDVFRTTTTNRDAFIAHKLKELTVDAEGLRDKLAKVNSVPELRALYTESTKALSSLEKYFINEWKWTDAISEYVVRTLIYPSIPKFMYYNEYYTLPSRISINDLEAGGGSLSAEEYKTSKALFELADINIQEIRNSTNYEKFVAELEATSNSITTELFKYWTTNKNLRVRFHIDKQMNGHQLIPVLDIRIEDLSHGVSLPLRNRSKGFNWFFSFIVWFSKIQEDKNADYILLLDEPGMSLHASAQADFLKFIEVLSENYQVLFTTHSPFMVRPDFLHRVRTVLDTPTGTRISDSIQEKDPDTLFPLQAALGYDIAQNLFISKQNLLVEGVADLLYLTVMSGLLEGCGREGLKSGVTIVPVGGLDKVATFISLLRGSKLNVACFLDTFTNALGKQKLDDLIRHKIIKEKNIHFAHEFASGSPKRADLEDLFTKEEYLGLFNLAFADARKLTVKDLDSSIEGILPQINKAIGKDSFNHYRPAYKLTQMGVDVKYFSPETLDRFESIFKEINRLF